jgi:hypothetical protein
MAPAKPPAPPGSANQLRSYRAIARHTDGRIIHVRDIKADSDAEAILIVTARGSDIRTDLWSDSGLVRRFGLQRPWPVA